MRMNLLDWDWGLLLRINSKPHHHPNCIADATATKVLLPHLLILEKIYHQQNSLLYHPAVHKILSQPFGKILKVFEQFINLIVNVQQHN